MVSRPRAITALCLASSVLSLVAQVQTPRRRKPRPAPVPKATAAQRGTASAKVEQYLEDSAGRALLQPGALVPVFEQLARLAAGQEPKSVHMMHFGDSHTAADEWTGGLRELFKARFGDGGAGFSVAGHPFPGYRRSDAPGGASPFWHSYGGHLGAGDGYYGLGGVAIYTGRAGQSAYLDAICDRLEIDYLIQPGGGALALYDNELRTAEISTDGEPGPGSVAYQIAPGQHRFKLVTLDARPVRLFGWAADRTAGITYEALGLNGAEAVVMQHWDEAMTATYLQHRNPGLIVLAYGTNEASDSSWSVDGYRQMFGSLLDRLRHAAPAASILVIGPTDRWRYSQRKWQVVPGIDSIIEAQQAACREHAAAFWDARERMGGKGAMKDWVYAGLAQWDYVHFTVPGYRRLAAVLFTDLMEQFDAYQKTRIEIQGTAAQGQGNHGQTDTNR